MEERRKYRLLIEFIAWMTLSALAMTSHVIAYDLSFKVIVILVPAFIILAALQDRVNDSMFFEYSD